MAKQTGASAPGEQIDASEREVLDRLIERFDWTTSRFIEHSLRDQELAGAMGDKESELRERIKGNVMRTARQMFQWSYIQATGERRRLWSDDDEL